MDNQQYLHQQALKTLDIAKALELKKQQNKTYRIKRVPRGYTTFVNQKPTIHTKETKNPQVGQLIVDAFDDKDEFTVMEMAVHIDREYYSVLNSMMRLADRGILMQIDSRSYNDSKRLYRCFKLK